MKTVTKEITITEQQVPQMTVWDLIEPVWYSIDIYSKEGYRARKDKFSIEQVRTSAIFWYQSEVSNGGHDQFFFNSTGIVWKDALDGFAMYGLKENFDILKDACDALGGAPSFDREKRWEQIPEHSDILNSCDNRLYSLDARINFEDAMRSYIDAHAERFAFHGVVEVPDFDSF